MVFTINISLCLLFVLVGVLLGWAVVRSEKRKAFNRQIMLVLLLLMVLLVYILELNTRFRNMGIVIPMGEGMTHYLPLPGIIKLIILSSGCSAVSSYCLIVKNRFRLFALCSAGIIVCFALHSSAEKRGVVDRIQMRRSSDGLILQSTAYSCSAAVCANIAEYYGMPSSERVMVEKLKLTEQGASPFQVVYLLKYFGIKSRSLRLNPVDMRQLKVPAILSVYHEATGPESHLIIFMGIKDCCIEIIDPLLGRKCITEAELMEIWQGLTIQVDGLK